MKLKGTCKSSIEDDLCAAIYYLSLVSPSIYGDLPIIVAAYTEEDFLEDREYDKVKLGKTHLSKPSHPIALRYFYHADLLGGEECLLYYYKVLEHFFDYAWRLEIIDLVSEHGEDIEGLAQALAQKQPDNEEGYLRLVLKRIESDKMWNFVTQRGFPEDNLHKLTKNVDKVRNKVAHGKDSRNFEVIVPRIILDSETHRDVAVLRFLAEQVLTKLGNVDS